MTARPSLGAGGEATDATEESKIKADATTLLT
jgi:hypothetical protein